MVSIKNNYYLSSFFWSTLSKILSAILGFVSVPLLISIYGKANYGIIALATSCNAYMQLLDLGMNIGTVKFFSQWKAENKIALMYRVAHTNITFYLIMGIINIIVLLLIAFLGDHLFAITSGQLAQLKICLYIIASLSIFSWCTTAFNQLLIADQQLSFTMKVQCIQTILKLLLIVVVIMGNLSLTTYFALLTIIVTFLFIPYSYKCLKDKLIDNILPGWFWNDFKIVLTFSLSLFALSIFQVTATQSRPLILSAFAESGADAVAEFRIIEVVPQFIIMVGGSFSSIFLPKTTQLVVNDDLGEIRAFQYKWTRYTTIIANILCFPFILCSSDYLANVNFRITA